MSLRSLSLPLTALLGAALSLLPGCKTSTASGPPPPSGPQQPPSPPPPPPEADAWKRARVGDRVAYTFSTTRSAGPRGSGPTSTLGGQVALEVVAVQPPWLWVRLSFMDEAGKPLSTVRLAQELVLPVRADATRPLEVTPAGEATAETASGAGRTWEALRYVSDQRPVDGPLRARVYAREPGPLYLTHGLVQAETTLSGFGAAGGSTLTLREVREGSATTSAPAPALERPLGPGAYYDRRVDQAPTSGVHRVCFSAERGYLLRTEGPVDTQAAPCADFSQAEPEPLEEVLLNLAGEAVFAGNWPPTGASAKKGTFTVEGRDVPALIEERTEKVEGVERVFTDTYAEDPWAPGLAGLPHEARFQPLANTTERVVGKGKGKGKRESEGGTRLVRWGTWLGGAR